MAKEYQKRKCHCACLHTPQCGPCESGSHRSWQGWHEEFECSGPAKTPWNNPEFNSFTLRRDAPPGKTRPEPNMPTLNELVNIGIGRQVHEALMDANNASDFDRRMRELERQPISGGSDWRIPLMITESVPEGRGWFYDQYVQSNKTKPVEPKPPEDPTYPTSHPRKMRIKK